MAYLSNTIVGGSLRVLNGLYANTLTVSGTTTLNGDIIPEGKFTKPLIIQSSISGSYNEGIRITKAGNSWAGLVIGCNAGSASGAPSAAGGWFVAQDTANRFLINNVDSSTGNASIWIDTNKKVTMQGACNVVGALTQNGTAVSLNGHTHSYLPLSGGTITGGLTLNSGFSWPGGANVTCTSTANSQEWSIDLASTTYTGTYWHVWSGKNSKSIICCYNDDCSVTIPNGILMVKGNTVLDTSSSLNAAKLTGTVPAGCYTNTTYSGTNGISLSGTTFSNSGVRSIATGSANGTISVNTNGTAANVAVKGLDTAAYVKLSSFHKHAHAQPQGGTNPFYLIASFSQSVASSQINTSISFYVSEFHSAISYGILNIRARYEVNATSPSYFNAVWSLASNIDPNNFIITHKAVEKNITLNVYCKRTGWSSYAFNKIEEQSWGPEQDVWTCYGANKAESMAAIPDGETQIVSVIGDLNNSTSGSAAKLGTSTVGGTTTPIYLNGGTPTACSYTIAKSVPSNAVFTDTTYTGTNGISLSGTTFSNSGVRSVATGSTNGTISVNTNGTAADVAVKGLGTAAYTESSAYAAASHGNHVPATQTASNSVFLRNDNTWQTVTPANIGAAASSHTHNYAGSSSAGGAASSLLNFTAGTSSAGEHNANNIKTNGVWYYTSNGPAKSLGASTDDGALYSQAYSTAWAGQIAQDYRNGHLFVRGLNNGSFTTWLPVLTTDKVATGSGNGTIAFNGTDVAVKGLGTAAYTASTAYAAASHGNHVPTTQTANNAIFLRNDNSWQTVTPANIGAAASSHTHNYAGSSSAGGAATSATTLTTARYIDGISFNGSADISHYGECTVAAGTQAKTVACTGFALKTGSRIVVKFTNGNTHATPTLNVNSTGAKNIYYKGAAVGANIISAGHLVEMIYDGTQYQMLGNWDMWVTD